MVEVCNEIELKLHVVYKYQTHSMTTKPFKVSSVMKKILMLRNRMPISKHYSDLFKLNLKRLNVSSAVKVIAAFFCLREGTFI